MLLEKSMPPARSGGRRALHGALAAGLTLALGWSSVAAASELDGAQLSPWMGLPFVAILLSIALLPILAGDLWGRHFGKITAGWTLLFLLPFGYRFGPGATLELSAHVLIGEYLPFIILLFALFVISGGIFIKGNLHGSAELNTALLALGTLLASLMGTTGAAMLLIRPLLRANDNRRHNKHVPIFFIFLVANVGGALTPLGDPPLFLGFLQGVDFFWTLRHLALPVVALALPLLLVFYLLDRFIFAQADELKAVDPTPDSPGWLLGKANFLLLIGVMLAVLLSGVWKPGIGWDILGTRLELQDLTRDLILLALAGLSMLITHEDVRERNEFEWAPIQEVAKLFLGIFLCIAPVIAMLQAGPQGPLSAVLKTVSNAQGQPIDLMYFWVSGILSSFLDNAPTYLLFFNMASGDAQVMMSQLGSTLLAISMGSVFMGAMTYIGNAPNFMVKSIAEQRGVKMPGFFGYMLWSCGILLPLLAIVSTLTLG